MKEEEDDEEEMGVLQKKLEILAMQIGQFGLVAAIFVVIWLAMDFSFERFLIRRGWVRAFVGAFVGAFGFRHLGGWCVRVRAFVGWRVQVLALFGCWVGAFG